MSSLIGKIHNNIEIKAQANVSGGIWHQASQVPVEDKGNYFTKTNLEDILQEIGDNKANANITIVTPTLYNNWVYYDSVNYSNVAYYKDGFGIVHLQGVVKNGTVGSGNIFTLPSGFRPSKRLVFNNSFGRIDIFTNGEIQFVSGNNSIVSLDGITFMAM